MILYVEDELYSNIPAIIDMFGWMIGKKAVATLHDMEHDPDGFGADNAEICRVLNGSPLDVAYTLPMALEKLTTVGHASYDVFVLDRNLCDSGELDWETAEVQAFLPNCTEQQIGRYVTREGDFLLWYLAAHRVALADQVFFLTANAVDADAIRGSELFQQLTLLHGWQQNNVIEKGGASVARLKDHMRQLPRLRIRRQNPKAFSAARCIDCEETTSRLFDVISAGPNPKFGGMEEQAEQFQFDRVRLLFEALIGKVCVANDIRPKPTKSGTVTAGHYLGALRDSEIYKKELGCANDLNYWTSVEDSAASMVWDICGAMLHYDPRKAYAAAQWSKATLYQLAYNGIIHLYEWAGRSRYFGNDE